MRTRLSNAAFFSRRNLPSSPTTSNVGLGWGSAGLSSAAGGARGSVGEASWSPLMAARGSVRPGSWLGRPHSSSSSLKKEKSYDAASQNASESASSVEDLVG